MRVCFLLLYLSAALLLAPLRQTAVIGQSLQFPEKEPFLLHLHRPLWTSREARERVLRTLERRHHVKILKKLPQFTYLAVLVRKKRNRALLADPLPPNVSWVSRKAVRSVQQTSFLNSLPEEAFRLRGGKTWGILSQSFLTGSELTTALFPACRTATLQSLPGEEPRLLHLQGAGQTFKPCLKELLSHPKTVWAHPQHQAFSQNRYALPHTFGTIKIADFPADEEIVTVLDTGIDTRHCLFHSPDAPKINFHLFKDSLEDLKAKLKQLSQTEEKVIAVISTSWRGPNGTLWETDFEDNPNGHGTHVAGTAAGDGCLDQPSRGPKLIFFDIQPTGEEHLLLPPLITPLLEASYEAGSRIFTNSWGSSLNYYSTYAFEFDTFVKAKQDAVVLVANGNDGKRGIGSPATAKNVISVGATFNTNDRWTTMEPSQYRNRRAYFNREEATLNPHQYDATHLADFSSRGPAYDGRRKPMVVVPGAYLLSARAKGNTEEELLLMQGTSMATPLLARAVAALRQRIRKASKTAFVPQSLVRAVLSAHATPLSGGALKEITTADKKHLQLKKVQNTLNETDQGFGKVNLGAFWNGKSGQKTYLNVEWTDPPSPLCFETVEGGSRIDVALAYTDELTWILEETPSTVQEGFGLRVQVLETAVVLDAESPLDVEKRVSLLYPPKGTKLMVQLYPLRPQHTVRSVSVAWRGPRMNQAKSCSWECTTSSAPLPCAEKGLYRHCTHDFTWSESCSEPSDKEKTQTAFSFERPRPPPRRLLSRLRQPKQPVSVSPRHNAVWVVLSIALAVVIVILVLWAMLEEEKKLTIVTNSKRL